MPVAGGSPEASGLGAVEASEFGVPDGAGAMKRICLPMDTCIHRTACHEPRGHQSATVLVVPVCRAPYLGSRYVRCRKSPACHGEISLPNLQRTWGRRILRTEDLVEGPAEMTTRATPNACLPTSNAQVLCTSKASSELAKCRRCGPEHNLRGHIMNAPGKRAHVSGRWRQNPI